MNAPITHADLIRAVLDGKTVQWQQRDGQWATPEPQTAVHMMTSTSSFWQDTKWRLKPESLVRWCAVFPKHGAISYTFVNREAARHDTWGNEFPSELRRLELDPDTLEVISSTTEAL